MRENINLIWAELILVELQRQGARLFHIAPGRRNAPFCIMAERLGLQVVSHFDERSLAFHALGAAKNAPAVLICTSGTAGANFFPAVAEASESALPLIVITADRPHERHRVGDWQAIDQVKLFGTFVREFIDLPLPTESISPSYVLGQVGRLVNKKGPVHMNCRLAEPLMDEKRMVRTDYLAPVIDWLKSSERWNGASLRLPISRGVITVGALHTQEESRAALALAHQYGWPLFPDITSGLRSCSDSHIIHHFEWMLEDFHCDGVVHVGGKMVSKKWEAVLEALRPKMVSAGNVASLQTYTAIVPQPSPDLEALRKKSHRIEEEMGDLWEEAAAVRAALNALKGRGLFLANSLAVRTAQNFAPIEGEITDVMCNRGASGIDGMIASSVGFARGLKKGVVAIVGDIAFLYDVNALALLKNSPEPVTLVVINNSGGGIFSLLTMPQQEGARSLIETPHSAHLEAAAQLFDIPYTRDLTVGLNMNCSCMIEVCVSAHEYVEGHRVFREKMRGVSV